MYNLKQEGYDTASSLAEMEAVRDCSFAWCPHAWDVHKEVDTKGVGVNKSRPSYLPHLLHGYHLAVLVPHTVAPGLYEAKLP